MAAKVGTFPGFPSVTRPLSFFISSHPASSSSSPPKTNLNLGRSNYNIRLRFVAKAADSTQPTTSSSSSSKTLVPDNEFTLAKVSSAFYITYKPLVFCYIRKFHYFSSKSRYWSDECFSMKLVLCYLYIYITLFKILWNWELLVATNAVPTTSFFLHSNDIWSMFLL